MIKRELNGKAYVLAKGATYKDYTKKKQINEVTEEWNSEIKEVNMVEAPEKSWMKPIIDYLTQSVQL